MKKILTVFFLLALTFSVFSQKYSFGKISMKEMEEQQSAIESEAPAEIIYKNVFLAVDIDGTLEIQVTERIKIYSKERAEEFLTYEIPLNKSGNKVEKISGFRASSYNLENGSINEMKLKTNQTFTEEKHKYLNLFKFTFPDVRDGSVLEYKYTISSPFIQGIPVQYFDYKIPLRFMDYTIKNPSILYYIPDMRGLNANKIVIEKKLQQAIGFSYSIVNLKIENVNAYEEEPFVLNYENVRTSIRYELAKIDVPGQSIKSFSTTWKEVGETLLKNDHFEKYYRSTNQFKNLLPELLEGKTTDIQKARAILKYVQNNYVWNKYTGVLASQSLDKTIKERTGDSADLNLLLIAMLREAGIDANPVVLSTVSNGMLNYAFPSLQKLDYVIAGYYENNELNILDATNRYSEVNQVPKRVLNYRGFYIKKGNIHEVDLFNKIQSSEIFQLKYKITPDMEFVGTLGNRSTHYFGMSRIEEYERDKIQYEKDLRKKYAFPVENLDIVTGNSTFRFSFGFNSGASAEKIGNKIVFNPLIFLAEKDQVFKAEKRTYPIELGSSFKYLKNVSIIIPEGYKVETLPESRKFIIEGSLGSFIYIVKASENQIEVKTELVINEYYLPAEYYEVFKEFWQHMIDTEDQLISLIRE